MAHEENLTKKSFKIENIIHKIFDYISITDGRVMKIATAEKKTIGPSFFQMQADWPTRRDANLTTGVQMF